MLTAGDDVDSRRGQIMNAGASRTIPANRSTCSSAIFAAIAPPCRIKIMIYNYARSVFTLQNFADNANAVQSAVELCYRLYTFQQIKQALDRVHTSAKARLFRIFSKITEIISYRIANTPCEIPSLINLPRYTANVTLRLSASGKEFWKMIRDPRKNPDPVPTVNRFVPSMYGHSSF